MVDIKISGRKVTVSDALRDRVNEKIGDALKVFDISPMSCDVVLRVDKNPSNPDRKTCEVTVFVRKNVVRVVASADDMYAAIDEASDKVTRQLRKYKTRVIDYRMRETLKVDQVIEPTGASLDELMAELSADDEVVRVKEIEFTPMTEEEAMIQIDLLGHDFLVYTDRDTNEVNVMYRRTEGGYGLLKPKAE